MELSTNKRVGWSLFSLVIGVLLLAIAIGVGFAFFDLQQVGFYWVALILISLAYLTLGVISPKRRALCFLTIIFLLPIHLDVPVGPVPHHIGGARPGIVLWPLDLPLALLWVYKMIEAGRDSRNLRLSRFTLLVFAMSTWWMLSIFTSVAPDYTLFEVVRTIKGLLIFLALVDWVRDVSKFRLLIIGLLIAVSLQIMLGLAQHIAQDPLLPVSLGAPQPNAYRLLDSTELNKYVGGTVGQGNVLGVFLNMFLPMFLGIYLTRKRGRYWGLLLLWIMGMLVVFFTYSRAAWLVSVLSTVITFGLARPKTTSRLFRRWRLLGGFILIIILILIFLNREAILLRLRYSDPQLIQGRIDLDLIALDLVRQHPVWGIGLNAFTTMKLYTVAGRWPPVHNGFLLIACETGVLGMLLWLILCFSAIRSSFQLQKRLEGPSRGAAIGLGVGLVSLLLHSMSTWAFRDDVIFVSFWIIIGLLTALKACRRIC